MSDLRCWSLSLGLLSVLAMSPAAAAHDQANDKKGTRHHVLFDASLRTLPWSQGFKWVNTERDHPFPEIRGGVLRLGPTSKTGLLFWHRNAIPLSFSPKGKGVSVEWTARVESSGFAGGRSSYPAWYRAGFGVHVCDKTRHEFYIYLAGDRVFVENVDSDAQPKFLKFDTTDRFHHYRFVVDDGLGMLFIDGKAKPAITRAVGMANAPHARPNSVAFGDFTITASTTTHIKGFYCTADAGDRSPFHPKSASRKSIKLIADSPASANNRFILQIVNLEMKDAAVEEECRGKFVVRNVGASYNTPPDAIGPSYGLFIHDADDKLLFRNYGAWGPCMKRSQEITFRWNTSSNHLGETSEPPFLIPAPGKYKVKIELYESKRDQILDVATKVFQVRNESP